MPATQANSKMRLTRIAIMRWLRHRKITVCICAVLAFVLIHWYMQSDSYLIEEFTFPLPGATTKKPWSDFFFGWIFKSTTSPPDKQLQKYVNYMAEKIIVNFTVIRNIDSISVKKFTLYNSGNEDIPFFKWKLYFYDVGFVGFNSFPYPRGLPVDNSELLIFHEAGNLYSLQPTDQFVPFIHRGDTLEVVYDTYGPHVSKYYSFPNWFVSCEGCVPRVLKCTVGEGLEFVGNFSKREQLKRSQDDLMKPFTAQDRFKRNSAVRNTRKAPIHSVIPTPLKMDGWEEDSVFVSPSDWVVNAQNFKQEGKLLAETLQLSMGNSRKNNVISFRQGHVNFTKNSNLHTQEGYEISIDPKAGTIEVIAIKPAGAFYAVQTLLSLMKKEHGKSRNSVGYSFPKTKIVDAPRFEYRGLMVDVSRNFVDKKTILKLLDVMAMYKVNKFHFHLSDDDGWRLEILDFPELTQFASNRCLDPTEEVCLPPSLGSGPFLNLSGTGFYTATDYKEILSYAKSRHIQVIPEIDVPGHARSAIKAMELRYKRTKNPKYRLIDPDDRSQYKSAQGHTDNAVNPCLDGTYEFLKVILRNLYDLHKDIQPLTFYMLGGDEVAGGAWEKSPLCMNLKQKHSLHTYHDLKRYFFRRLVHEMEKEGMSFGLWGDAVLDKELNPNPLEEEFKGKVYTYSWSNIWEWRRGSLAYKLANAGYKVVMSPATYFYFDHPYEPDPQERGLYWATRYLDSHTAFSYQPDHLYWNRGTLVNGGEMTDTVLCSGGCPPLTEPQNIRGLQVDLWTETIRTPEQVDYMLFPRFLAFAERAWHKAPWESMKDAVKRNKKHQTDWEKFAQKVGHKELRRLEEKGVSYRLDPPGARFSASILEINTIFPGLPVEYSLNNGASWEKYNPEITTKLSHRGSVWVRSTSFDGQRKSRIVCVEES
uniref:beta-N-acetylhexosaminidase n=1 Tax=Crassostrea virginica TaxID=6565 RepID=A0A8B8C9S7_CRAVI|nr:uncharacterized protein LOC111117641 isoform X2 [Crassostrea virginica]